MCRHTLARRSAPMEDGHHVPRQLPPMKLQAALLLGVALVVPVNAGAASFRGKVAVRPVAVKKAEEAKQPQKWL